MVSLSSLSSLSPITFSVILHFLSQLAFKNYCISAAWKIVKTWLGPEAISKLRFASKSEVQTFIGPEYLPAHMGGTVRCYSFFNGQYSCL